jgi:hypothetical protein
VRHAKGRRIAIHESPYRFARNPMHAIHDIDALLTLAALRAAKRRYRRLTCVHRRRCGKEFAGARS